MPAVTCTMYGVMSRQGMTGWGVGSTPSCFISH